MFEALNRMLPAVTVINRLGPERAYRSYLRRPYLTVRGVLSGAQQTARTAVTEQSAGITPAKVLAEFGIPLADLPKIWRSASERATRIKPGLAGRTFDTRDIQKASIHALNHQRTRALFSGTQVAQERSGFARALLEIFYLAGM